MSAVRQTAFVKKCTGVVSLGRIIISCCFSDDTFKNQTLPCRYSDLPECISFRIGFRDFKIFQKSAGSIIGIDLQVSVPQEKPLISRRRVTWEGIMSVRNERRLVIAFFAEGLYANLPNPPSGLEKS